MVYKCSHCGQEYSVSSYKKYYLYKLKDFGVHKTRYFCSYSCMQAEKRSNPDKYRRKRMVSQ